jgi:hypothetical protein
MTERSPFTTEGKDFSEWSVNMISCRGLSGGDRCRVPEESVSDQAGAADPGARPSCSIASGPDR